MKTLNNSNKNKMIKGIIVLFALGAIILNSCSEEKNSDKVEGMYVGPMHPQITSKEPGTCPICGMDLVFVPTKKEGTKSKEEDHSKHTAEEHAKKTGKIAHFQFSVANELLQKAKIQTVAVKSELYTREKSYSGHIDFNEDPNRLVIVNTKYEGWIERLYVSKEGQRVYRGTPLMAVYSQKILAAKEEYITTFETVKNLYVSQGKGPDEFKKDPTLRASRNKLLYLDISPRQIVELEKTGKAPRRAKFYSPISGVIVKKNVLQGSQIKPGQELFRIADLRSLWIFIHIFEKDLPFIKKGQRVSLTSEAYPGKKFYDRIDLIYPFFDQKTRDVRVRIIVKNPRFMLKPGMFVNVDVKSRIPGKVLTIPELAILYSGEKNYVFVSQGQGHFEVRPVTVRTQSKGIAIISKGLKKNEQVVINSQFLLDSEASLKEALLKGQSTGHQH